MLRSPTFWWGVAAGVALPVAWHMLVKPLPRPKG